VAGFAPESLAGFVRNTQLKGENQEMARKIAEDNEKKSSEGKSIN